MTAISPASAPFRTVSSDPAVATVPLYRRFVLAGIASILTAGASWGALLLWKIGLRGQFTEVSIHEVNAHGHAQIVGWVGLFIMGFATQVFPRFWGTSLALPALTRVVLPAMLVGLVAGTTGMALHGTAPAVSLAMLGHAAVLLATVVFATQILATYRRATTAQTSDGFLLLGLLWLVAQAALSLWHTWTTMTATNRDQLLWYVATYQAPLRDLQIHGLALFMILGVSQRLLPRLFGLPATTSRRAAIALTMLTLAVLGESLLFVAYRWSHNHILAACLLAPWLLLAGGVALLVWPWRLWRALPLPDRRSGKFIRAAFAWLTLSLLMLLLLPLYQAISGIAFSHAYYGAIRHAITVGFVSLMIMGMSARLVPSLLGVDPASLSRLWGPFLLINLGCFLRVSLQIGTDWHPAFFPVVGVSGLMEVAALAWWGLPLGGMLLRGRGRVPATLPV